MSASDSVRSRRVWLLCWRRQSRAQDAGANPLTAVKADRWTDAPGRGGPIRRSGGGEAGALFAAAGAGRGDGRGNRRLHAAQSRLARPGRCWSAAARKPSPPTRTTPSVLAQCAELPPTFGGRHAALRRGDRQCRPHRGGQRAGPQAWVAAVDDRGRRSGVPAPLGRHCLGGRPVGALPAPCLEQRAGRGAADHPPRSGHHAAAEARLAAKRDDPQTEPLVAVLPAALQADPGPDAGPRAGAAPCGPRSRMRWRCGSSRARRRRRPRRTHLAAFWSERNVLARQLLHDGDAEERLRDRRGARPDRAGAASRRRFLAGFIALRMLNDPAPGRAAFPGSADSPAAITRARAHYWLGRTAAAAGSGPEAGIRQGGGVADDVLRPACRAGVGRRARRRWWRASRRCAIRAGRRKPPSPSPSTRSSAPPPG